MEDSSISDVESYTFEESEDENGETGEKKAAKEQETLQRQTSFGKKWPLEKQEFEAAKKTPDEIQKLGGGVKRFYKRQNELVDAFFSVDHHLKRLTPNMPSDKDTQEPLVAEDQEEEEASRKVKIAIYGSFSVNILLFCMKIYASVASGSLSVIASALDSFLDLLRFVHFVVKLLKETISGSIIFATNFFKKRQNPYKYPAGKERLEPLGIIIFSSCMFTATLQLITQSVEVLLSGSLDLDFSTGPLIVIICTVVFKFMLWLYCRLIKNSASVDALRQDHRNDVISNSFGVCTALIGYYFVWWVDPAGGICIGLYIMSNWFRTGYRHVQNLTGKSATSAFLQQITFLCWNHDPRIKKIDTVRAFHLGLGFLVEVDIVLPEDMSLREAHDIGQTLQDKLEHLNPVERAFVHLDYEADHIPEHIPPKKKVDLIDL